MEFNASLKLSNHLSKQAQWRFIEKVLENAEKLGDTPEIKKVIDNRADCVIVLFKMNAEQRADFKACFSTEAKATLVKSEDP